MTKYLSHIIRWATWCYLLFVAALWLLVFTAGDRWWPATVILFAPRWIAALPLLILLPLAAWRSRFSLIPLLLGAGIVFGPFMGFNIPNTKIAPTSGKMLRVLTCNIENGTCDMQAFSTLIREVQPDVVAIQESPREVAAMLKLPPGWLSVQDGELTLLSRFPLQSRRTVQAFHPPHKWPRTCLLQCTVEVPGGNISFNVVHLPSPRYGLQNILDRSTLISLDRRKLLVEETSQRWQTARSVRQAVSDQTLPVVVVGDFNMTTDSAIYKELWGDYSNAFSRLGYGYGWTERADMKKIPIRIRIDHLLTGPGLETKIFKVGPDVGSDHVPLIVDVEVVKR